MHHHPEDIPKGFVSAWNKRDARELADLFTEDAEFVNVVGLWWHNRQSIYKAHDYGLKVIFNDSHLRLLKTKVKYLTDTIAVVHARMHLTGQSSRKGKDEQPEDRYNLFSFVAQKFETGWLCVSAHNTDIVPGAEPNVVKDGNMTGADYRK
jgi:uncharacterized protein (TIGR02246 family)